MSIFKKIIKQNKVELLDGNNKSPMGENTDPIEKEEYEIVEIEILPEKIICPDCGGITLVGLDFCDKCGGELISRD